MCDVGQLPWSCSTSNRRLMWSMRKTFGHRIFFICIPIGHTNRSLAGDNYRFSDKTRSRSAQRLAMEPYTAGVALVAVYERGPTSGPYIWAADRWSCGDRVCWTPSLGLGDTQAPSRARAMPLSARCQHVIACARASSRQKQRVEDCGDIA